MFAQIIPKPITRWSINLVSRRYLATLERNPHIYIHDDDRLINSHVLSLLPDSPPKVELAIGKTTQLPPTPDSFTENRNFLAILHEVLSENAFQDASVISQAQAMASSSGSNLGTGGAFFPQPQQKRRGTNSDGRIGRGFGSGGDGAGAASIQGGAGGGGRGGYIHVYDHRNPPDYGRIPWPEDIFGSLEVDSSGNFVDGNGRYQSSGTYRIITREGCLGLSPFLRERLVERLQDEAAKIE